MPIDTPQASPFSERSSPEKLTAQEKVLDLLEHPEQVFTDPTELRIPKAWVNAFDYALINPLSWHDQTVERSWRADFDLYTETQISREMATQFITRDLSLIGDSLKFYFYQKYPIDKIEAPFMGFKLTLDYDNPSFYESLFFARQLFPTAGFSISGTNNYLSEGKDQLSAIASNLTQTTLVKILGYLRLIDTSTFHILKDKIDWSGFLDELSAKSDYDKYTILAAAKLVLADDVNVSRQDGMIFCNTPKILQDPSILYEVPVVPHFI